MENKKHQFMENETNINRSLTTLPTGCKGLQVTSQWLTPITLSSTSITKKKNPHLQKFLSSIDFFLKVGIQPH